MNILTIDTSTNVLRLGLSGNFGWREELSDAGLRHGENLFPALESLLAGAGLAPGDLELIVCVRGPGSFTGLRIGMSAAKGLAEGLGCPLVSLSSLEIMGNLYGFFNGLVVPVMDAKKQRFYAAGFSAGRPVTPELDALPEEILDIAGDPAWPAVLFAGPGAALLRTILLPRLGDLPETPSLPSGPERYLFDLETPQSYCAVMSRLGRERLESRGPDGPDTGPVYIRPSDAELKS